MTGKQSVLAATLKEIAAYACPSTAFPTAWGWWALMSSKATIGPAHLTQCLVEYLSTSATVHRARSFSVNCRWRWGSPCLWCCNRTRQWIDGCRACMLIVLQRHSWCRAISAGAHSCGPVWRSGLYHKQPPADLQRRWSRRRPRGSDDCAAAVVAAGG